MTKLGEGGGAAIPSEFCKSSGIEAGAREAVRRAQALVRSYVPKGHSLSDELIAEWRREAERE